MKKTVEEMQAALLELLPGENRELALQACLSIASTTAVLMGMSKVELQQRLILLYDKRLAEGITSVI